MSKLFIIVVALLGPFLLRAAVLAAAKRSLFTMKSMLQVLSVWHGLLVIVATGLMIGFYGRPPARYGWGALIFSFGLTWTELWLKRRMSPPPTSPAPRC